MKKTKILKLMTLSILLLLSACKSGGGDEGGARAQQITNTDPDEANRVQQRRAAQAKRVRQANTPQPISYVGVTYDAQPNSALSEEHLVLTRDYINAKNRERMDHICATLHGRKIDPYAE